MYKLINDEDGNLVQIKYETETTKQFIPIDNDNRHYQKYLEWVEAGNTPEPADE